MIYGRQLLIVIILVSLITFAIHAPCLAEAQNKSIFDNDIDPLIVSLLDSMTLEEKIGQMLMLDFRYWREEDEGSELLPVTDLNSELQEVIKRYSVGGVILFSENLVDVEQAVGLTRSIQETARNSNLPPLFISVDQEGGSIVRINFGTPLPGMMALGATGDEELAYRYGEILGKELHALGLNLNLAPVLDVNNNPNNPVIGLRSLSSSPELVAKLGSKVMAGLQDTGLAAAAKHFPGHGDTSVDSHLGLPVVDKTYEELKALELAPFTSVIERGVDVIMTTHISYPQIETDLAISRLDGTWINIPATLSDDILTGTLREDLGFEGVIITDALNMQAISDHFGETEAVIMAIQAGADILLAPTALQSRSDFFKLDAIIAAIKQAIQQGNLSEARIDESVRRILTLKQKRDILKEEIVEEESIDTALLVVGSNEHLEDQRAITQRAITVTKNQNQTLPLQPVAQENVLILTPYTNEIAGFTFGFKQLQEEGVIPRDVGLSVQQFSELTTFEELQTYVLNYDHFIIASEIEAEFQLSSNHWLSNVPDLVTQLAGQAGKRSVVVSLGNPYDVGRYNFCDAMVVAFGARGMDEYTEGEVPVAGFGPNIPYSLDIIFGKVAPSGKLPVDVPALDENYQYTNTIAYPVGFGLTFE